ncbi:MAG: tripartite tricarboxylate transporter substrate binding protein [Pigmentiphaga sp.]|nr:tripartite tricarboxylate transporter substrate binding protein [Pigmentiphaga sp.]
MKLKQCAALFLALGVVPASTAWANYPDKPIRMVVSMPAGGPMDVIARTLTEKVSQYLGQPVVIENRGGSGGNIGAASVANANPDGYTYLLSLDTTFTINPHLYASMGFDLNQLTPVAMIGKNGMLLVTNAKKGISTLDALIKASEKEPINFSTAGNGSPGHFTAALLKQHANVNYNHIPYRGNAPATMGVVSGEVTGAVLATPGLLPHVNTGALTALGVTGQARSALLPNVPTMTELGYPEVDFEVKYVVFAPAGTDESRQKVIADAVGRALNEPDVKERLKGLDTVTNFLVGQELADALKKDRERYGALSKAANMQVD